MLRFIFFTRFKLFLSFFFSSWFVFLFLLFSQHYVWKGESVWYNFHFIISVLPNHSFLLFQLLFYYSCHFSAQCLEGRVCFKAVLHIHIKILVYVSFFFFFMSLSVFFGPLPLIQKGVNDHKQFRFVHSGKAIEFNEIFSHFSLQTGFLKSGHVKNWEPSTSNSVLQARDQLYFSNVTFTNLCVLGRTTTVPLVLRGFFY